MICSTLRQRQIVQQVGTCGQLARDSAVILKSLLQELAELFGETSTDGELEPEQPFEDFSQVTNKSAPELMVCFGFCGC